MIDLAALSGWLGDFSYRLVVTLLHFMWQGAIVGLVAYGVTRVLYRRGARHAYGFNVACLASLMLFAIVTFSLVQPPPRAASRESAPIESSAEVTSINPASQLEMTPGGEAKSTIPMTPVPAVAPETGATSFDLRETLSQWSRIIAVCYLIVVSLLLLRIGRGAWRAKLLKGNSIAIERADLSAMAERTAKRIGLVVVPALAWCEQISAPIVVGVIRPMILLPAAMIGGVTPQQLESILAHEMAHIRRFDLPINLFQRIAESLFFFHPAVWYLSRNIDIEREKAADDFALNAGCEPVRYADALLRMAELSAMAGQLAGRLDLSEIRDGATLAASGKQVSELKRRIVRVIENHPRSGARSRDFNSVSAGAVLILAPLLTFVIALSLMPRHAAGLATIQPVDQSSILQPLAPEVFATSATNRMKLGPKQNPGVTSDVWQLFCAASNGEVETVRQIIGDKPELMHRFIDYECPLQFAIRENQVEVVRILLDAGINPAFSNYNYSSWPKLLPMAKERGFDEIHAMLVAEMEKRFNYDPNYNPLWNAIVTGDNDEVKKLIEANPALVHTGDEHGNRAIHWAILCRRISVIQILLDGGADINAKRADMQTPLQVAVEAYDYWFTRKNHSEESTIEEVVQFVRDNGAEYDFIAAVAFNDIDFVKAELAENPDLANQLTESRRSPLFIATKRHHLDMVRLLLDHGADPNQPEHLASSGHALFQGSTNHNIDIMKLLLEHGALADAEVDSMGSCLSIAQSGGKRESEVVALLKKHLPVSGEDISDKTIGR